jgi:hypothetical protein
MVTLAYTWVRGLPRATLPLLMAWGGGGWGLEVAGGGCIV